MKYARRQLVICFAAITATANAQELPPVRVMGRVLSTSSISLASVSQVRALSDGRVFVNDNVGRRLFLFDSTLQRSTVVADTTDATGRAYGPSVGGLISYHGDSTLLVTPSSLSILVIAPDG